MNEEQKNIKIQRKCRYVTQNSDKYNMLNNVMEFWNERMSENEREKRRMIKFAYLNKFVYDGGCHIVVIIKCQ